jgi:ATP-dependent DNA helicase RecG
MSIKEVKRNNTKVKQLPKKENTVVEFKASFNDDVIETLVAFANTKGGKILIGVSNNGVPLNNLTLGKESIQHWLNEIKNKTQPSIIPNVEEVKYKKCKVVEFSIQEFPVKPVAFRGRYFKRVKNSNHHLSAIEISDMSMQTLQVSWDSYPAQNTSIKNIDLKKVNNFIKKVNEKGRFNLSGIPKDDLKKLKLINNENISNAALLLFSNEDIIYNVHLGRFKTPSKIIDDRMLRLPLFDAVEESMKYIISQIKFSFEIKGMPTGRIEIPEYPLDALRELLLNSIIHRDYLSPADIQIKIFDNYISFFNPGKLHDNLTLDDLNTNSYSAYSRNKLISEAFYLTGDIEKYGSGFLRIREAISSYPTMKMEFKEISDGFMVTLSYTDQKISMDIPDKSSEKTVEKTVEKILSLIAGNPQITQTELSEKTGLTRRGIEWNLSKLKDQGLLERIGADKGGYWKIN